jgi:PKD repeat protein
MILVFMVFYPLGADNVNITHSPGGGIYVGTNINFNVTGLDMSKASNMEWDFADGSPKQSGVSTSHSFKEPGNYTVKFTWLKNGNPRETTKNVNVGDNRNVSAQGSNFIAGMEIQFQTNNFVENQLKWEWGDGQVTNGGSKNEKHSYNNPGNYSVKVYDFNGNTSTAITCNVNVGADNRSISFSPGSPIAKQKINFTAQNFSSNNLRWDFSNVVKNGGANMENTYNNPGNYTVKVKDQQNPSLNEITVAVNVQPDPRSITLQTQPAKAKHHLNFQSNGFGSSNLHWDFGDNKNQNGGQSMSHVYIQPGNYILKVKDQSDQSLPEVTLNVNIQPDNRRVDIMPLNPGLYTEITFNSQNFPGGNLEWDFDDNTRTTGPTTMKHRYR